MQKRIVLVIALCLTLNVLLSKTLNFENQILKQGYNNVQVKLQSKTLVVAYENTVYRSPMQAVYNILNIACKSNVKFTDIVLVPKYKGMYLLEIFTSKNSFEEFKQSKKKYIYLPKILKFNHTNFTYSKLLDDCKNSNSDKFKADIIANLHIKAKFGSYSNPIQDQVNVLPEFEISLWKGMSFYSTLIVPVHNEFNSNEDKLRPGELGLNQMVKLPKGVWFLTSLGKYTQDRYGLDFQLFKHFSSCNISINLNAGYTGYAKYINNEWKYTDVDLFTYFTALEYHESIFDLHFKAGYGKFLASDNGFRFDLSRRFGNIDFGFFSIISTEDNNSGINFSIPFFSEKHMTKKVIRFRMANNFAWEYRALGIPDFGMQYRNRKRIDKLLKSYIF